MLGPAFLPFLGVFSPQRGEGTQQRKISEKERKEEITMEKIASFTIDHIKLQPGVYVSRKDGGEADSGIKRQVEAGGCA